jgi:hypothetical protein
MSELIDRLKLAGEQHKGTDFGGLLQWAALHIESQDDALAEARGELEEEQAERIRMEQAIYVAKNKMNELIEGLEYSRPVNIELFKDHAPHINVMAHHKVSPYASKSRKPKAAT